MTLSRLFFRNSKFDNRSLFGVFSSIGLMVFLALLALPNHGVAQNANERDIELPEPANPKLPSIYLTGDSTVRTGSGIGENSQWGWGSFLAPYFDSTEVNVVNRAIGGRSSRTYISQSYWDQQMELLKPGDIVLIQFGHNDGGAINDTSRARGVLDGTGEKSVSIFNLLTREYEVVRTYGSYLRTYISDIREKGATPIICSLVPRQNWDDGSIVRDENNFATWAEEVAKAQDVSFLDLNDLIAQKYEKLGPEDVSRFFSTDNTHTNREGAKFSARWVTAALKSLEGNPPEPWFSEKARAIEPVKDFVYSGSAFAANNSGAAPEVLGYGEGKFKIGEEIYRNDFENDNDWILQIEESDEATEPRVVFDEGMLDILMPGRGATIWNRTKFTGPVAITYTVKAPTTYVDEMGIVVRDINSFWHASDPNSPQDIFNDDKYTGAFVSYHNQQGYYASMGGRDNTTTRFRRYPREKNGSPVDHISLSERDGIDGYLIQPDKTHAIQLVVFEDVIQYIVDGQVFYEIRDGDTVTIAKEDGSEEEVIYTAERFPVYSEGWFGFRLVNTHHQYSNFRVHRLEPVD